MTRKFLLTGYLVFLAIALYAQPDQRVILQAVVPPSPNAASLGKYGEVPVSMYTGIPDITVPVYEINSGRIKLPISLSYHAGGIRVEETASLVGLGWSLNAGGIITRTVRGRPDDDGVNPGGGYFNFFETMSVARMLHGPNDPSNQDSVKYYNSKIFNGVYRNIDTEPDIFQLNAPGLSFKFYYNQEQKKFYTNPASKIQISFIGTSVGAISWKVVDANGLIYYFAATETTAVSWDLRIGTEALATSWLLTGIEDPQTGRSVGFQYQAINASQYINGISDVRYYCYPYQGTGTCMGGEGGLILQSSALKQLRIKKILFDQGEVNFSVQSASRLDFPSDSALKSIEVKNTAGESIVNCELQTSYFNGGSMHIPYPNGPAVDPMYGYRLKLDRVTFKGTPPTGGSYQFSYNEAMVNRLSLDQDRWGYYNAANNSALAEEAYITVQGQPIQLEGGNRQVSPGANQIGMLQRMTYPTGGYTDFEYETNRYSISTPGGSYLPTDVLIHVERDPIPATQDGRPYSYTETPFTVNGQLVCGAGAQVFAWGEINQLNNNAEYCPPHLQYTELRVIGTEPATQHINRILSGPGTPVLLPPGTYKLVMTLSHCDAYFFDIAQGVLHFRDCIMVSNEPFSNKYVGGLRIKSMTTHDPVAGISSKKTYDYSIEGTPGFSSAQAPPAGIYAYHVYRDESVYFPKLYKRMSYSSIPLASTKGRAVGYERVTENRWEGNVNKGFEVYIYAGFGQYPDIENPTNEFPFKPVTDRDYMRGLLTYKQVFGIRNNTPYLIQSIHNEYETIEDTTDYTVSKGFIGGTAAFNDGELEVGQDYLFYSQNISKIGVYKEFSDMPLLSKVTTTTVAAENPSLSKVDITDYTYSSLNFQPKTTTNYLNSSPSDKQIVEVKYAADYFKTTSAAVDAPTLALKGMVEANRLNEPIEIATFKNISSIKKLTGAKVHTYQSPNLQIKQVDVLERTTPLVVSDVTSNQSGTFTKIPEIKPAMEILAHDMHGNILSQRLKNNVIESYQWGYSQNYPVAKVINAPHNEVFHDNFEETGGWDANLTAYDNTKSHTGTYAGRIDKPSAGEQFTYSSKYLTVSLSGITKFKYSGWIYSNGPSVQLWLIMNDWAYSDYIYTAETNKWVYIEKEFTVPANVTKLSLRLDNNGGGTVWFDDIRLHPSAAQMTTYTYKPLVGMTSQTDANNRVTYYEYDAMGRLVIIRDEQYNVLKKICYNYAGQAENCLGPCINTTADWQNTTTAVRCQLNGSNQNTGYQEQEQKDLNPCSATYNQLRWVTTVYNPSACALPPACNSSNCNGVDKKCVFGVCETGLKNYISATLARGGGWNCVYKWVWSDCSVSEQYSETRATAPVIGIFCH